MNEDDDPNYEIAIGTLDNPELGAPCHQVGVESELSWLKTMIAACLASVPRTTARLTICRN